MKSFVPPSFLVVFLVMFGVACGEDGPSMLDPSLSPSADPSDPMDPNNPMDPSTFSEDDPDPASEYAWVSVAWEGADADQAVNLDLHVLDAEGTHIYYLNTGSNDSDGRFAPHDECISFDCDGDEEQPRESVYWRLAGMESGTYEAWVENAGERSGSFDIEIVAGDTRMSESSSVAPGEESRRWVFEIGETARDTTDCLRELDRLGVDYQSITISEGVCEVEDAVMVNGPINGITYRVDWGRSTTRFRTACETVLALHDSAPLLKRHDITDVYHLGSYNCRNKNGGSGLSQHGLGRAMDYAGFKTSDGTEYSVVDDWEHDTNDPQTEAARVLREIAQGLEAHFDVVLDPDYNDEHDDHVHGDLAGR